MIQVLANCLPTPCIWPPELLTMKKTDSRAYGPLVAVAAESGRGVITLRLGEDSLSVELAFHQLAVPTRGIKAFDHTSTEEMVRVSPSTTPLPSGGPPGPLRK
jgi:hypothetical protein